MKPSAMLIVKGVQRVDLRRCMSRVYGRLTCEKPKKAMPSTISAGLTEGKRLIAAARLVIVWFGLIALADS